MRSRHVIALLGLAIAGSILVERLAAGSSARAAAQCGPEAIGLARTIEIDAKGGPRFGENQYTGKVPLLRDGEVILTFDDGPHKTLTQPILDALDGHCTKATFFMVGQRALYYPELVRKVAGLGHTVATHTWTHQNLAKIPPEEATDEIELGISAVQKGLGGPAAPFFRFPYLSDPKEMTAHLRQRNTAIFSIDIDSYDFKTRSATAVIRNVMSQLEKKGKGIVLFHDIQPSTAGAIGTLLGELKAKGYRIAHIVPKQGQTTLADYDKRIVQKHGGGRLASLPVPVAQRGIVSPAWEVQVYRGQGAIGAPSGRRGYDAFDSRPTGPPAAPPPRPSRQRDDDWQTRIFRGW